MHCLDIRESFKVYRLEHSDESLIQPIVEILEHSLGNYRQALIKGISEKKFFALCALGEGQEVLGAIIGWIIEEETVTTDKYGLNSSEYPTGYIKSLGVKEEWQRKGIGSCLVRTLQHCFSSFGCQRVTCEAFDKSLIFWQHQGFKISTRIPGLSYEASKRVEDFCSDCGTYSKSDAIAMYKEINPNLYDNVEVKPITSKGRGVFSRRSIPTGEIVFSGKPIYAENERTCYSIQVDWDKHLLFDRPAVLTNHSCDPNCGIRDNRFGGFDFIAIKDIAVGEEITWDYAMSEYISIAVESCKCGSPKCRQKSGGWHILSESLQRKYKSFSASYIHSKGN
ncbi:GNAT family N-acetyltransferase [Dapis sp. BLCC M229]|uniref:GNAT family N-acetyltransferase n=1 Tax=Dapis sp. BLCC M229 TaxID=3400188 RepID=UPI003CEFA9A2